MPKKRDKKRERTRIIVLIIIGSVAFVVSVYMNIVGMKNAIEKAPDSSGMAGISVRTDNGSLKNTNTTTNKSNTKKTKETDMLVNCVPIISLINNDWDRVGASLHDFKLDGNGNAVFDEGYTLYCNGTYVNYAIFNSNYKKEVIGHCKAGDDLDEIQEKLGKPTFTQDGLIGYKTREVYAFFYNDEIVIYPNRTFKNNDFEEAINSYSNKTYGKERTYFVADVRKNYPDFVISEDDDNNEIIMESLSRQVILKLDGLGNIEAEFYNGYEISLDATKEKIEEKIYTQNDDDLVEKFELERIREK